MVVFARAQLSGGAGAIWGDSGRLRGDLDGPGRFRAVQGGALESGMERARGPGGVYPGLWRGPGTLRENLVKPL